MWLVFAGVVIRSDNEPAILALKESTATAFEVGRCECQDGRECSVRFAKQRIGRESCEGCERRRENEFGLSRQTLWTRVPRMTPSPDLACEVLRGDGEQVQKRSRWARQPTSCARDASSRVHCRISGENPLHGPCSHERCGESRTKMGRWNLPWCVLSDQSDELYVGKREDAQDSTSQTPRGHRTS